LEQEPQTDGELQLSSEEIIALIRKIEGGDPSALATLYDKTSRLLYGLASRILGERTLAEETLLDIYTHIWKQAASYDPGIMPLEWLMMIARTQSIAMLHWSRQIKKKHEASSGSMDSIMTVAPEEQKTARSHIGTLIPVQREIMDWIYFSGLSCSEIAMQIGKPIGAIRTHTRLGMSKLDDLFHPLFEPKTEA
jgi:RNA polymerase sigma-70 factor, ECF subfamily